MTSTLELLPPAPARVVSHVAPQALGDDSTLLATLFAEQRGRLLRLALRIVGDVDVAADVVQDAMLAALQALPEFRQGAAPSTWLHRIVVNAALMHLRRARTRRAAAAEALAEVAAPPTEDPLEVAGRREAGLRLRRCLAELPDDQRNVIELRDILGLDTEAAARELGVSPNALKIRLHRARRALRARFEGVAAGSRSRRSRTDVHVVRPHFVLPSRSARPSRLAG